MKKDKVFYKMRLVAQESGLAVTTTRYIAIRESPCMFHCVEENLMHYLKATGFPDELYKRAKEKKMLRLIHKNGSNIAFDTEEKAFNFLKFMKSKQLAHLKREQKFIEFFLRKDPSFEDLKLNDYRSLSIPNSKSLVDKYLRF